MRDKGTQGVFFCGWNPPEGTEQGDPPHTSYLLSQTSYLTVHSSFRLSIIQLIRQHLVFQQIDAIFGAAV